MARNQPLLSECDLRPQGTRTRPPPPRQEQAGCIGMHHARPSEMRDAATSLSCQLTTLIASGRWMAPSDHLHQPRENGCLQNVKQSVRHAKSSETHILKLKVKPNSHRIHSDQRSWAPRCGFPVLGPTASSHQKLRGCSRFPHQLQPTRTRGPAGTVTASTLLPCSPNRDSQRRQPQRKPQPGAMHQGQQTRQDWFPQRSPILPHGPVRPTTHPTSSASRGEHPPLCCEHQGPT